MGGTPRCDAELAKHTNVPRYSTWEIDFARQLETELQEQQFRYSGLCDVEAGIRRELSTATARVKELEAQIMQLRGALNLYKNWQAQVSDSQNDSTEKFNKRVHALNAASVAADNALILPPPPCVPLEDVKPLLDALELSEAWLVNCVPVVESTPQKPLPVLRQALTTFRAKHSQATNL